MAHILIDGRDNSILDVYSNVDDARREAKYINLQLHRNCTLFKVRSKEVLEHSELTKEDFNKLWHYEEDECNDL